MGVGEAEPTICSAAAAQLRNSYLVSLHEVTGNMKLDKLLHTDKTEDHVDRSSFAITLAFILLLLLCSACGAPTISSQTPVPPEPAEQPAPPDVLWPDHIAWREMALAGSEVTALLSTAGEPDHIQSYPQGEVYQYWPDAEQDAFISVTLVGRTVRLVGVVAWPGMSLGQLGDVLVGRQAEELALPQGYRGRGDAGYAFPLEGFAIGAEGEVVTAVQYFAPTDAETYLNQWGLQTPWQVPFPSRIDVLFEMLEERGAITGRTRTEVESGLGQPEATSRSDSCGWSDYRMVSSDRVWAFDIRVMYSDTVTSIIYPWAHDGAMTFADVIREFGLPDLVMGNQDAPRNQTNVLALIYLAEGLQVEISGLLSSGASYPLWPGESGQFGGEGTVFDVVLFTPRSRETYLEDPCLRVFGEVGEELPWEVVSPFRR